MAAEMWSPFYPVLLIAIVYFFVILWFFIGWQRLRIYDSAASIHQTQVSVIVPARNEETVIRECLESILKQDCPKALFEILVIDDHSTDATALIVKKIAMEYPEHNLKLLSLGQISGKKAAIQHAMRSATGSLILTTDADCWHPPTWINSMVRCFEEQNPVFLSGPVLLSSEKGLFGKYQELEFMSLIASGAGAIGAGTPIMCNGANLGFSATAYRQLEGDVMRSKTASGDDVFMMLAMKERFGVRRIVFVKDKRAICTAKATVNIKEYFHQRLRWVSKSQTYRDPFLIMTAVAVFLMNLGILVYAIAGIRNTDLIYFALFLLVIKMAADFPLLLSFSQFSGKKNKLWILPFTEILVIVFTTIAAIAGNLVNVSWKGRKVR